jgi:Na+/phosphate symporter
MRKAIVTVIVFFHHLFVYFAIVIVFLFHFFFVYFVIYVSKQEKLQMDPGLSTTI